MPGGPRSGSVPNLGVNPMNYQGNMPSGPVGASLGGLTPQAAQIQEVMAMLGNLNEGQLQTVQQHMQDRFVTMQQRRGVPEVFGDGLGRAADSSFVTPQPFDVLPGFGVSTIKQSWKFTTIGCLRQKRKMVDTGTNTSEYLEDKRRRGC